MKNGAKTKYGIVHEFEGKPGCLNCKYLKDKLSSDECMFCMKNLSYRQYFK